MNVRSVLDGVNKGLIFHRNITQKQPTRLIMLANSHNAQVGRSKESFYYYSCVWLKEELKGRNVDACGCVAVWLRRIDTGSDWV